MQLQNTFRNFQDYQIHQILNIVHFHTYYVDSSKCVTYFF